MAKIVEYLILDFFVVSTIWSCFSYHYVDTTRSNNGTLRVQRQAQDDATNNGCITPTHPTNGHWSYLNISEPTLPFTKVSVNTTIGFKCNSGYILSSGNDDTEFLTCKDDTWNSTAILDCNQLCPPFYSTSVIRVSCKNEEPGTTVHCDKATNGTVLTYQCAQYYIAASYQQSQLQCLNGFWDYSVLPLCIPECGKKAVKANVLIVGGRTSRLGKYPWVIALYSNRESDDFTNICGGTLLTPGIVLTAAHCVSNERNEPYKTTYFRVSAGKFFREYEDIRDYNTTQNSKIKKIMMHSQYRGERQFFRYDIALLTLETNFILSDVIQPVCFSDLKNFLPGADASGWVSGWGYQTTTGDPSDVLKEVELPLRGRDICFKDFDQDWADRYFTDEKLCAGYLNQNVSVCKGDSGGGLVFQHTYNRRFYIYGIVSLSYSYIDNTERHCDIQKSALFTKVESYFEWLQTNVAKMSCDGCQDNTYGLSTDGCDFCSCFGKFCPLYRFRLRVQSKINDPKNQPVESDRWWQWSLISTSSSSYSLPLCEPSVTTVKERSTCKGQLIFENKFDRFWKPEFWTIQKKFATEPEYEFVIYDNSQRTLSLDDDSIIFTPVLTDQIYGKGYVYNSSLDLGEECTGNKSRMECSRHARVPYILPPISSAQITTKGMFSFKYGTIEIRAKLPKGDWLYPELFLNSENEEYGPSYKSGQIRIAFTSDNRQDNQKLEGGLIWGYTPDAKIIRSIDNPSPWADEFHNFTVLWTPAGITLSVDNLVYGNILPPDGGFSTYDDTSKTRSKMAPFDKEMHIVVGVGAGGFIFDDRSDGSKPWRKRERLGILKFYKAQATWLPTWENGARLEVQHVKVWALEI